MTQSEQAGLLEGRGTTHTTDQYKSAMMTAICNPASLEAEVSGHGTEDCV